jgi:hypothetical protein
MGKLKLLVGSGDRIMLLAPRFAIAGVPLNVAYRPGSKSARSAHRPPALSIAVLIPGVVIWAWSVVWFQRKPCFHASDRNTVTSSANCRG